jgi:hypothetical protein
VKRTTNCVLSVFFQVLLLAPQALCSAGEAAATPRTWQGIAGKNVSGKVRFKQVVNRLNKPARIARPPANRKQ